MFEKVNFDLGKSGEVYAVLFKTGLRKNGKLKVLTGPSAITENFDGDQSSVMGQGRCLV